MRQSITLLIIILIGLVLYTVYGLVSYEPQRAAPFVFADPVLPPELLAYREADAAAAIPLSAEQKAQTDAAVSKISEAVTLYQTYEKNAAPQAASTFEILNTAVLSNTLPAYLLSQTLNASQQRTYDLITVNPTKSVSIDTTQTSVTCDRGGTVYDVVAGDNGDNRIECNVPASETLLDRVFLGGPGNDVIVSAHGDRIIDGGTGDDTITAGPGRTLVVLDDAWGKDTLTIDCKGSKVEKSEIPEGFPVPWEYEYTNFIVLSPSLNRADISWNGLVLTNKTTGDTLSVNENCFNLISAAK